MGLLLTSLADWDGEHFLQVGKRMKSDVRSRAHA